MNKKADPRSLGLRKENKSKIFKVLFDIRNTYNPKKLKVRLFGEGPYRK